MWRIYNAPHATHAGMTQPAVGAGAVLVRGLGGVGKSLLAQEDALRFGAAYPGGVFWLRGRGGEGIELSAEQREADRHGQLDALARTLLGPERAALLTDLGPNDVAAVLRTEIERGAACLWVVDYLPAGLATDEVRQWLVPKPAATLITERSATYGPLVDELALGVLTRAEGIELLTARRRPDSAEDRTAAEGLVDDLGGHVLALDVAGAALRFQSFRELHAALANPDADELELAAALQEELPTGHERSIATTLSRSIDRLGAAGADSLSLAAVLASAPIPDTLISAVLGESDGVGIDIARQSRVQAPDQAYALSLADPVEQGSWRVHRLVSRAVRARAPGDARRAELRGAAVQVLTRELANPPDASGKATVTPLVAHARELAARDETRDELTLLGRVASLDHASGGYGPAARLWEQQWRGRKRLLGDEHADSLEAANDFAMALYLQGQLGEARALQAWVHDTSARTLGREHFQTLTAANPQPVPRSRPKRLKEAKRRLEEELFAEVRANRAYEAYRGRAGG